MALIDHFTPNGMTEEKYAEIMRGSMRVVSGRPEADSTEVHNIVRG